MFCQKCGNKIIESAVFCPKCGAKLAIEETEREITGTSIPTLTDKQYETTPLKKEANISTEETISKKDTDLLKSLIGRNSDYYLKQFEKIERGEKSGSVK